MSKTIRALPKKSKSEHAPHSEERHSVKVKSSTMWQVSSFILAGLLVLSILTSGFRFGPNVDSVIKDLNTLKSRDNGAVLNSAISNSLTTLETAKKSSANSDGDAKIVIEEYSDFQCPFCGRAYPTLKQITQNYGNDVKIIFKHFPLSSIHPAAQKAAEASECAEDQGKFWEYHDKLFENQNALDIASLKKYAADLGLDESKFNSCLDSGEKSSVVQQDFNEGQQKGVSGTPTFFINGQQLVGAQPYENFKAVIDAQLSGAPPQQAPQPQPQPEPQPSVLSGSIDDDPVKGSPDAKLVLIEWSDFQCPYCGRFYSETLPSIEKEYIETGKLRLVYRDFPLSFHPEATPSAEAAECAKEQGKFWEFHDKVFENQGALSAANYKAWATQLGLDSDKFNSCVDSRKYQQEVQKDFTEGQQSGVTGTPGFLLGVIQDDGKTVIGVNIRGAQPFPNFKSIIDAQLAGMQ